MLEEAEVSKFVNSKNALQSTAKQDHLPLPKFTTARFGGGMDLNNQTLEHIEPPSFIMSPSKVTLNSNLRS
jgi:hypothetical protein